MAEKRKLTAYEEELKKATTQIKTYKNICEANIVSLFWKNPDLIYMYPKLNIKMFHNNIWKVYYTVCHEVVVKESKQLEPITVSFYLEKHPKLRDKFDEYGGYDKIVDTGSYVNEDNIDAYVIELQKWNVILEMIGKKFPIHERISEFVDMSIEDIYDEYNAMLNHIFSNAETETKSYSLVDNIDELIEKLDVGIMVGLDYYNSPLLNSETGGRLLGSVDILGALSNVGKSTISRNMCIPSAIKKKEPLCIIINEESLEKTQVEMLVYVANIILHKDLSKFMVRNGKFTPEIKEILKESANWLKNNGGNDFIRIIPFQKYTIDLACKVISKYSHLGFKYFIIDTLKLSSNSNTDVAWLELQKDSVKLYDLVKPEGLNVHVLVTYQLGKASTKQRYLNMDSLGQSKNIVDIASCCLLWRNLFDDEFEGGKNELKAFRLEGKNGKTQIPIKLTKDKHYQICFITKNRSGRNNMQIIYEHDLSKNKLVELGFCIVPMDY